MPPPISYIRNCFVQLNKVRVKTPFGRACTYFSLLRLTQFYSLAHTPHSNGAHLGSPSYIEALNIQLVIVGFTQNYLN